MGEDTRNIFKSSRARVKPAILVVEDQKEIASILQFAFKREGFFVFQAADGKQALKMIEELPPPKLALFDIMLPYVDGFQLIKTVREKPEWKDVPIIMLSAKSMEKDIVKALSSGANDYITKPFQVNELIARVKRYLK